MEKKVESVRKGWMEKRNKDVLERESVSVFERDRKRECVRERERKGEKVVGTLGEREKREEIRWVSEAKNGGMPEWGPSQNSRERERESSASNLFINGHCNLQNNGNDKIYLSTEQPNFNNLKKYIKMTRVGSMPIENNNGKRIQL